MGDRANYAIRTNGKVELFYSHWGAVTVAEDIFWGLQNTEDFIRRNEPTTEWLDDIWAQGGVALDKDNHCLTWLTQEWPDEPDILSAYEKLLAENWQTSGWTVNRAPTWQALAASVGVDPAIVTSAPTGPAPISLDRLGDNLANYCCCALLTVRHNENKCPHYAIDFSLPGVLINGPAILSSLDHVADLAKLREVFVSRPNDDTRLLGDWLSSFCVLDIPSRKIYLAVSPYDEQNVPFVAEAWPDWTIETHSGGAMEHFAFLGLETPEDLIASPASDPPPAPPQRSFDECVRLIQAHLAANEQNKATRMDACNAMVQQLAAQGQPLTLNPHFHVRPPLSKPGILTRIRFQLWLNLRRWFA